MIMNPLLITTVLIRNPIESLLGLATAKAFAEAGASVAMSDVNAELLKKESDALISSGFSVI